MEKSTYDANPPLHTEEVRELRKSIARMRRGETIDWKELSAKSRQRLSGDHAEDGEKPSS